MAGYSSSSMPVPPTPRPARVGSVASTTMRKRVLESAALGEWKQVRQAVEEEGCSVNIQDEKTGLSLVHWACHQGLLEELTWLVGCGAFLRLRDKRGQAPLAGVRDEACKEVLLTEAYSPAERVIYGGASLAAGSASIPAPLISRLESILGSAVPAVLDEPLWDEDGATLAGALVARHGQLLKGGTGDEVIDVDGELRFNAVPALTWLATRGANMEAVDEGGNALLHLVDPSLGAGPVLALINWLLHEATSLEGDGVKHFNLRNREGDTAAILWAYQAPSGGDALRVLRSLESAGSNLALASSKGLNAAMVLACYWGDGPWINWFQDVAHVEPSARCSKGRTVADYIALHDAGEVDDDFD